MIIIKSRWQYPIEYYRLRLRQFTKKVSLRHDYHKKSIFPEKKEKKNTTKLRKADNINCQNLKDTQMSFGNIEDGVGKPETVRENTTPSWDAVR